ncbi:MAG: LamG domain-containing protein, partial [Desulfobulbus sp.]|nr:LamG domain-containing protein [Desulfobulbus sp.]
VTYADLMTTAAPSHWWRLAETSGTSLVSAVGGWTATLSGSGYTLGAAGLLKDDANKAIAWGANADQYAQVALNAAHLLGTGDFSVSMLVKYTSTSFATLLAVRSGASTPMLVLVTSSRITAGDISAETWAWSTTTTRVRHPGVNDGKPHHVVVNYKHATTMLELWVDGVLRDSRSQGSGRPTSGTANVFIGNNGNFIQGFTSGAQDEIAMFGRALAQTEIENLADVALNGPRAGSGVLNASLRVELESARNSLVSLQKWNLSVTRG